MTTSVLRVRHGFARGVLTAMLALGWVAVASSVRSEPESSDELDAARALFRDGLSLEVAGNWGQALSKFERVAEVRFTPQVRFHIARCKEHLGRITEALGDYRISEYEAERDGLAELSEIAEARENLEARVPKLTLVRATGAERSVVELDGVEIGEASIDTELGVDLGRHHVVARSPGREPFEQSFVAEEGGRYEISIEQGPALAEPVPTKAVAASEPASPAPPTWDAAPAAEGSTSVTPWLFAGVAAVGAGAGVVFLVRRSDAIDEQKQYCSRGVCNADFRTRVTDAESKEATSGTLAIAAFSVSAAALGTAVTLWLLADDSSATGVSQVTVTSDEAGLALRVGGRF